MYHICWSQPYSTGSTPELSSLVHVLGHFQTFTVRDSDRLCFLSNHRQETMRWLSERHFLVGWRGSPGGTLAMLESLSTSSFLWVSYGFQVAISPQTHEIRGCARQECDAKVVDLQEEVPRLRCSDGLRIWEVNSRVDEL